MSPFRRRREGDGQKADSGRPEGTTALIWRKFRRHRLAQLGGVLFMLFVLMAVGAPFFSPYDPDRGTLRAANMPPQRVRFFDAEGRFSIRPFVYARTRELCMETLDMIYTEDTSQKFYLRFFVRDWEYRLFGLFRTDVHLVGVDEGGTLYLFGTDGHGRDLLSRTLHGGRITLLVAVGATLLSGIVGATLGAISGFFGGAWDMVIQRVIEAFRCFPELPLWMGLSAALPRGWNPHYTVYGMVAIFALFNWPVIAREVRAIALSWRESDSVAAARAVGAGNARIISRHVLPHAFSHLIVAVTVTMPWLIIGESTLSFFGLGIQPPMASWGSLMQRAQSLAVLERYPWILIPGIFVMLSVLAVSFLGDGLRDAADPYSDR